MLRGQIATRLDHEREQAGLVARTLEQFSRALPAPAADAAPPAPERDATALARQAADLSGRPNRRAPRPAGRRHRHVRTPTLDHEREPAGLVARTLEQFSRALPAVRQPTPRPPEHHGGGARLVRTGGR